MKKAKLTLHPEYKTGEISPRLFGAFLEPIGSMVNGSMFNPKHPSADELGLRSDFYTALKEAGMPCVRLPGGNFVSGWEWKDSIGPKEQRKVALDMAWRQFIPNDVGHDEYLRWAERTGAEAMYTINLGTGTLRDAVDLVEYTNFEGGSYWSDLRAQNGHKTPYGVKTWYLGNEMDGPWQIASYERDPKGYGVLAHEVSKAIKWTDPKAETVACVSSSPFLAHYPDWDRAVLEECYDTADYISLHHYHSALPGDIKALMAGTMAYEDYIRTEIGLCDYIASRNRVSKKMMLSFDEYSASFRPGSGAKYGRCGRIPADNFCNFDPERKYIRHDPDDWSKRQFPWRVPEMISVLANMSVTLTLLRHADRVKIGCATSGINMLCATDREHVWKGAAYYPMRQLICHAKGVSLLPVVKCDTYDVPGYAVDDMNQYMGFENVPTVTAAAALDEEKSELTVFVINADEKEEQLLSMDLRGFEGLSLIEHLSMSSESQDDRNTYEHPDQILPRPCPETKLDGGLAEAKLKPLSWNMLRFSVK